MPESKKMERVIFAVTPKLRTVIEVVAKTQGVDVSKSIAFAIIFDSVQYEDVFDVESEKSWEPQVNPIKFSKTKEHDWKSRISCPRLEITCEEIPSIYLRYDTVTGVFLFIGGSRIGSLDCKLRIAAFATRAGCARCHPMHRKSKVLRIWIPATNYAIKKTRACRTKRLYVHQLKNTIRLFK